jgi:Fe-S oxidoreductase
MFPDDDAIASVKAHFFDPFEYLMLRHKDELIDTEFPQPLGKVAYHVACHQRVQNFGMKTRDFLQLIPDTEVTAIERCSGHDGTYAVKAETYEKAKKIARPVVRRVVDSEADTFGSDCPMAGRLIADGMDEGEAQHPVSMVRKAYGI